MDSVSTKLFKRQSSVVTVASPRASTASATVMVHKSDHKSEITGVENDRERKLEMNSFDFR